MNKRREILRQTDDLLRKIDGVTIVDRVNRVIEGAAPSLGGTRVMDDDLLHLPSAVRRDILFGCLDRECECGKFVDEDEEDDAEYGTDHMPLYCDYEVPELLLDMYRLMYSYECVEAAYWLRQCGMWCAH